MSVSVQSPLSSPLPSQVFSLSTLETLSPPPTPIAKRGASHHFFPSRASTPTPMFFPKSKSLLGHSDDGNVSATGGLTPASAPAVGPRQMDENTVENQQRLLAKKLASRGPVPSLRLAPRPRFGALSSANRTANDTEDMKKLMDQMPPPPLYSSFPDMKSMEANIPQIPSLSSHSINSDNDSTATNKKKPSITTTPSPTSSASSPSTTSKMPTRHIVLPMKQPAALSQQQVLHKLPSFQRNGMAKRSVPKRMNSFVARSA